MTAKIDVEYEDTSLFRCYAFITDIHWILCWISPRQHQLHEGWSLTFDPIYQAQEITMWPWQLTKRKFDMQRRTEWEGNWAVQFGESFGVWKRKKKKRRKCAIHIFFIAKRKRRRFSEHEKSPCVGDVSSSRVYSSKKGKDSSAVVLRNFWFTTISCTFLHF